MGYQALIEQSSSQKLGRRGLTGWPVWASECGCLTSTSWKDASVINAGLWRIGNDCTFFRVLWPPYKWRLLSYGAHTSNLLPFLGRNWNLCSMKRQGLVVFAGGSPRDSGSVPMLLCLWELCFSLVSPLWELCYSLASC